MQNSARSKIMLGLLASACVPVLGMATAAHAQDATTTQTPSQDPQAPQGQTSPEVKASGPAETSTSNQTPAPAAEQPSATAEIIVTAQFRSQRLQDTPLSITAVNAQTMEARSQTNLQQVADYAPNVNIKPQGTSFGPSISASIRGIGQNDFNPAFEPGVAIYIDDVYYPQLTGAIFDLLDLDRVEILRGPQGTLTGRNSIGGAVKMFSKKPLGTNTGYVEGTYGSSNRLGLRASADFKVAENVFARVAGVFKRQEGYVKQLDFGCVYPAGGPATFDHDNNPATAPIPVNPAGGVARVRPAGKCKVGDLGGIGYQAIRGSLRFVPSDRLEITLSGDYTHDEHTISGEVLTATTTINNPNVNPAPGVPYDNRFICGQFCNFAVTGQPAATWIGIVGAGTPLLATSGTNKSEYDGWGVSGRIHYDLTDSLALESITGYRKFDSTWDSDDDISPARVGFGQNDLGHWDVSQEVRLLGKIGSMVDFTLGGFYFKQNSNYWSYQDIRYVSLPAALGGLPLFPLQFIQPDRISADAKAAFAHVDFNPFERLTLSGGLRYTKESKQYQYFRLNPDGTVNPFLDPVGATLGAGAPGALTGLVGKYKGSKVDWRAAAQYRFAESLMAYASVSTGFKGGGVNPRPFFADQVIPFDPETVTAYEVGFKSDFLDRAVRLNVSAFLNDYKDIQLPFLQCGTPPRSPCAARLNAGDARMKGLEVETTIRPVADFLIDGSLSYLTSKYTKLNPSAAFPTNPAGVEKNDPPFFTSPKWKATVGAQYEFNLGSAGSLTPRVDVQYQAKQFAGVNVSGVAPNLARERLFLPAYTTGNARLTYRSPGRDWEAALEVTNFTDKYYYLSVFDLRGAGAGFRKQQPGRPREWALTIKKKF
jgi:iron complex outermembrane recepter protein